MQRYDLPDGASSSSTSFLMEFDGSEEADLSLQNETGFSRSAGVTVKTLLSDSQSEWSKMRRQNESPKTMSGDRVLVALTFWRFWIVGKWLKVSKSWHSRNWSSGCRDAVGKWNWKCLFVYFGFFRESRSLLWNEMVYLEIDWKLTIFNLSLLFFSIFNKKIL